MRFCAFSQLVQAQLQLEITCFCAEPGVEKTLLMGILSKIADVNHIITVGFATCSTASSCKEHPIVPRVFEMDWLSRNEGRDVLHFVLKWYFLVYIYPGFFSYEEQLL